MATRCLVEIVLDTGQRYQSVDLPAERAGDLAADMRSRAMVVAVTLIDLRTGECATKPSCNLMAGLRWMECMPDAERRVLAEALGPLPQA